MGLFKPIMVGVAPTLDESELIRSHKHYWTALTNPPDTATRWPDWLEVTGKPTTFTPEAHTHVKADITDFGSYEAPLGNPASDGQVLASTVAGVRSWVTMSSGVTDHGALTGLADDDHIQYWNDTRGNAAIDARVTKTFVDALNVDADTLDGIDSTGFALAGHNHDADYISLVATPTAGNFPTLTAGGELLNSTYGPSSFALVGHKHDSAYAPLSHTHVKANITDFAHTHLWADITDKPATFTPSAHGHAIADVTGLQTALDGKAASSHTHSQYAENAQDATITGKWTFTSITAQNNYSIFVGSQLSRVFGNEMWMADNFGTFTASANVSNPTNVLRTGDNSASFSDGQPAVFTIEGVDIPATSSVTSRKALVFAHGSFSGNLKVEVKRVDGVWATAFDGAVVIPPANFTLIDIAAAAPYPSAWNLTGMRFTFSGYSGTVYIGQVGITNSRQQNTFEYIGRQGGVSYGNIAAPAFVEGGSYLSSKYAPVSHGHAWGDLTGIPAYASRWPSWTEVTSKPATFTPSAHGHVIADVTGLQTALDGKASTSHNHSGTYQPLDADLTSIAGLAGTSGLLRKTAADTWSLDTAAYLTANQTITLTGDVSGSGTTSISVTVADDSHTHDTRYYTETEVDTLLAGKSDTGHTHQTFDRASSVLSGANVFSNIVVTDGIVSAIATRALTAGDIGAATSSHTHSTLELGGTTDTTLSRLAAGKLGVEGKAVIKHAGAYTSGEVTFSTGNPSGGSSGDIWFKYS